MDLTAVLSIMVSLVILMIILFVKVKRYYLILITFLFSLVIGALSLTEGAIPFTPFTQLFFLLFNSVVFYLSATEYYENKDKTW